MKKSCRGDNCHKRYLKWIVLSCMVMSLTGCNAEELFNRTAKDWSVYSQEESVVASRTLSLQELESQSTARQSGEKADVSLEWTVGDSLLYQGGSTYAFTELSAGEQVWYRDMEQALGKVQGTVKLSEEGIEAGLDESHVDKVFQSVLIDHPELFYVEGYSYTKYTRGDRTVAVEFTGTYSCDVETIYARKHEIELAVEAMIEPAGKLEEDYEKIKYVYETLIAQTDYDVNSTDNQNIYSVLVNRSSVCQGYAKAFQYLMYRLGVECTLVQGKVIETGEGHAWNLVKSNGDFYYVDPTWGDISYQNATLGEDPSEQDVEVKPEAEALPGISYDYLCVTTEQLLCTHAFGEPESTPLCIASKDNYYVREGALFEEYSEEQMAQLVEKSLAEGRKDIAIRCSNRACYEEMKTALLDRQELFHYLAGSGIQSFVYSCNESQLTLTFFVMTS